MAKNQSTARLISGKDLIDGELHELGSGFASIFTTKAPDKDTGNEDAAAIIPYDQKSGILVVADGVGGLPSGGKASEIAINAMRTSLRSSAKKEKSLRAAILDGIEKANREVSQLGVGAATTLAIAEVREDKMRPYHVGDSQILLIGGRGKVKLQTKSHSPVGYAVEAGLINQKEAMHHEDRHIVSNLIGDPNMTIEVGSEVSLAPKDTLVVASDGLFDNLLTEEIVETCRKGQLLAIARQLAESCQKRMVEPTETRPSKPDDLTFITFRRRDTAA